MTGVANMCLGSTSAANCYWRVVNQKLLMSMKLSIAVWLAYSTGQIVHPMAVHSEAVRLPRL